MKKLLFFISIVLLSTRLFGQCAIMQDVIYLRDGNVIRGVIIEQVPNVSYKIQTPDRTILTFTISEVEKITREPLPKLPEPQKKSILKNYKNITELGISLGVGMVESHAIYGKTLLNDATGYSLTSVNGWLFTPNIFAGIGIGAEKESSVISLVKYRLPLYLDARVFFLKKNLSPFFYWDMGYAWTWVTRMEGGGWGGLMMNTGIGASWRFTRSNSLMVSLGYRLQQNAIKWYINNSYPYGGVGFIVYVLPGASYSYEYENTYYHFITIKAGVSF